MAVIPRFESAVAAAMFADSRGLTNFKTKKTEDGKHVILLIKDGRIVPYTIDPTKETV